MKLFLTLSMLFTISHVNVLIHAKANGTAEIDFSGNDTDTSEVIIRVCTHPPGKEKKYGDYVPAICAYSYENGKLIMYQVTSFDLIYQDEKAQTLQAFHIDGNTFYTVRGFLVGLDTSALKRVFFDNVSYIENHKNTITAKGRKQLFQKEISD